MKAIVLTCCMLLSLTLSVSAQDATAEHHADQNPSTGPQMTFNSSAPLGARLTLPPASVQQRYRDLPKPSPMFHELTQAEHLEVESVLQELPSFTGQMFAQHVRSISFIDGIPANATTTLEAGSSPNIFNIVLRAGLLTETTSEFLTRKERGYYTVGTSGVTVSVEAGSLPAVAYVLVHESVHVLDISNRAGQEGPPRLFASGPPNQLVQGIWEDVRTTVPAYQSPLLKMSWFGSGKQASLDTAEPTYRFLARTPFVSLYGSSNWYDDIAELVACYFLTQSMKQPYRIAVSRGPELLDSLQPMNSALVQARFPHIMPLFD